MSNILLNVNFKYKGYNIKGILLEEDSFQSVFGGIMENKNEYFELQNVYFENKYKTVKDLKEFEKELKKYINLEILS